MKSNCSQHTPKILAKRKDKELRKFRLESAAKLALLFFGFVNFGSVFDSVFDSTFHNILIDMFSMCKCVYMYDACRFRATYHIHGNISHTHSPSLPPPLSLSLSLSETPPLSLSRSLFLSHTHGSPHFV